MTLAEHSHHSALPSQKKARAGDRVQPPRLEMLIKVFSQNRVQPPRLVKLFKDRVQHWLLTVVFKALSQD